MWKQQTLPRILAFSAFLMIGSQADSTEVTYTFEKLTATTTWNIATGAALPKFDSATLGTLNSVSLRLDYTFSGTGEFTNLGTSESNYNLYFYGKMGLTRSFQSGINFGTPWVSTGVDYIDVGTVTLLNLAPNDPKPFSYSQTGFVTSNITGADLSSFTGTGNLGTYLKAVSNYDAVGEPAGEFNMTLNPQAYGKITMTYSYTPIPEPSTYVLIGTATLTMGWLMKKRKRPRAGLSGQA